MSRVPMGGARPAPTSLAPLPELLAYAQSLGLDQYVHRAKCGLSTLASCRLTPNRAAIGPRLLARYLAIGLQMKQEGARPAVIREPRAFGAAVEGLGTFTLDRAPTPPHRCRSPGSASPSATSRHAKLSDRLKLPFPTRKDAP